MRIEAMKIEAVVISGELPRSCWECHRLDYDFRKFPLFKRNGQIPWCLITGKEINTNNIRNTRSKDCPLITKADNFYNTVKLIYDNADRLLHEDE